jgi:VWFA-related protein
MKVAVILALAVSLAAQEPRFNVRSPLVMAPVVVTDAKGRSVAGLEDGDFLLFDNGRAQKIIVDSIDTGVAPIALVIAVQSSGISAAVIEKVRKVGSMIQPLITGERGSAAVVSFDQRVKWWQEFTNDGDALKRAFLQIHPLMSPGEDKEARMLDAVNSGIARLRERQNERRVLLLISESRDRGSETSLQDVTFAAQTAGVAIYALTYSAIKTAFTSKAPVSGPRRPIKPKLPSDESGSPNGRPPGKYNPYPKHLPPEQQIDALGAIGELKRGFGPNSAEALATASGGRTFGFATQKALEQEVQRFGSELHTQYVISFAPDSPVPGYHVIDVKMARRAGLSIRARPGYWSN